MTFAGLFAAGRSKLVDNILRDGRAASTEITHPTVTLAFGTADDVLHEKRGLPAKVSEFIDRHEVLGRFQSTGSGRAHLQHGQPPAIIQPIEPGNDVVAARSDATGESATIASALEAVHRLAAKISARQVQLVQAVGGADFCAGTSFLRSYADHATRFTQGETPLHLTFLTQARAGPMPWVKAEESPKEDVVAAETPAIAPRTLRFAAGRLPARGKTRKLAEDLPTIQSEDVLSAVAAHRSDLLAKGLLQTPQAMIDLVRVDPASEKSIDPKVRRIQSIKAFIAARGTAGGAGVEMRRIERELGPLAIGSYTDVFEVANAHSVNGVHRRLRRALPTLAGYYNVPGDKAEDGTTRQAVLFALGHPQALARLPQQVRDGLGVDDLIHACAPAPIDGAIFTVWVEASLDEVESLYPDFYSHPFWPAVERAKEEERRRLDQRDGNLGVSA